MSGIDTPTVNSSLADQDRLITVLDRRIPLRSLDALVQALRPAPDTCQLQGTAICLDANVFLRLSAHSKSEDIIDYLKSTHSAPLILPGQAIQEFWNNQLAAVETVSTALKKKFEQLKTEVAKIDKNFGTYAEEITNILDRFSAEHGHVYDEGTVRKTLGLMEMLQERAHVPYASRLAFNDIAVHRKKTKTPPGFKDEGDGDFYIWVDLLTGLLQVSAQAKNFNRVVFVSNDQKVDWSRAGIAHPVLVAEVRALVDVPFEIWTIDKLASEIDKAITGTTEGVKEDRTE